MPSSVIRRFRYDRESRRLEITFVSGRIYAYDGVSPQVIEDFRAAASKGEFFNAHIRDAYAYREITSAA